MNQPQEPLEKDPLTIAKSNANYWMNKYEKLEAQLAAAQKETEELRETIRRLAKW